MQLPQIRLESTNARIKLNIEKPVQEIQQPQAELSIEQPAAELNIERTPSKLTIDQTKAREDMDLKHISRRIEEAAQQGYQDWLDGLERRAQDGDELMRIENGGDAIAEQAKRNSEPPIYDFNIGWIPSANSVQISYDPGKVDIQWKQNKPIINARVNKPILNYEPGKTNVELARYASLKVDFENLKYVGINYEQKI
ncbi:DUF6470 family protein [Bacillus songklensis]|uniref:DUF6470 family protein n=1 Tax=Bacillus songklensis TaxID=1069116 RepID=A0ABV8BB33_9BACI